MSTVAPHASLSGYCYESLVSYRNQFFDENGKPVKYAFNDQCERDNSRKIVAEFAFIPVALLGIIEGVFRLALSVISFPLFMVFGSGNRSYNFFDSFADLTTIGGLQSLSAAAGSVAGLVQNFREDKLENDVNEAGRRYLCCCIGH